MIHRLCYTRARDSPPHIVPGVVRSTEQLSR